MSRADFRIVVLGGNGNFGARVVRALQADRGVELIAAGRRGGAVSGAPHVQTAILDIAHSRFAPELQSLAPDLVIHCAGPFQSQDYRVAEATLAAGAHYLDLADGRRFVMDFPEAMNANALRCGRAAISGVSTLPALSTAVVDALRRDLPVIDTIRIAIAPGQRAPRGVATLAAVFSYLGRPIDVWSEGRWQTGWGWMDLRTIDLGFDSRWGALCDVPDLDLLPQRYPQLRNAHFHAALEFRSQHLFLWLMAALRRMGFPLPAERWAGFLERAASAFDGAAGEWGGMQVQVAGTTATGERGVRTWTLQAPVLNGPEVPCMAATLLARRMAKAECFAAGAFVCAGFLGLEEFAPLFAHWGISTRIV